MSRQVYVCNACHRSNIATLSSVRNYQVHDQLKIKIALLTNVGFELYFDNFFPSVMSFTSTLFLISSVVLPKTLLFISLKKSFSNEFLVVVRFCVLKSMYCFNQGDCLNCNALWTFFKKRKPYTIEGFCNEARNLFLLIMSELAFKLDRCSYCISVLFFTITGKHILRNVDFFLRLMGNHHAILLGIQGRPPMIFTCLSSPFMFLFVYLLAI